MATKGDHVEIEVDGRTVRVSNPRKVFFAERNETKLDLVNYYLAVGQGAEGSRDPADGDEALPERAEGDFFFQKRCPRTGPTGCKPSRWRSRVDGLRPSSALWTSPTSSGP